MLPGIGPEVVGGSFCPLDGHVNALRLLRALHIGASSGSASTTGRTIVSAASHYERRRFRLKTSRGEIEARQGRARRRHRQCAARADGRARARRCGRNAGPDHRAPSACSAFLRYPVGHDAPDRRRHRDDRRLAGGGRLDDRGMHCRDQCGHAATARAAHVPVAARCQRRTRTWAALRVMTPGRLSDLRTVGRAHPARSSPPAIRGVTLAAVHALRARTDDRARRARRRSNPVFFSAQRFDVQKAA